MVWTRGSAKRARLEASAELVPDVATAMLASGVCSGRELLALRAVSKGLRVRVSPVDALRGALKHGEIGDAAKIARLIPSAELVPVVSACRPLGQVEAAARGDLRNLSMEIISRDDVTELPSPLAHMVCMSLIAVSHFKAIWDYQDKLSLVDPFTLVMVVFDMLAKMRRSEINSRRFLVSQYDAASIVLLHLVIRLGWSFPDSEVMKNNCESFMTVVLNTRCSHLWRLAMGIMGPWEEMYLERLEARVEDEKSRMSILDLITLRHF
jgi:hypothetical protein